MYDELYANQQKLFWCCVWLKVGGLVLAELEPLHLLYDWDWTYVYAFFVVWCGGHYRHSCAECPYDLDAQVFKKNWCNGHCKWDDDGFKEWQCTDTPCKSPCKSPCCIPMVNDSNQIHYTNNLSETQGKSINTGPGLGGHPVLPDPECQYID